MAQALATGVYSETELILRILASGLSFYLYNEVAFYTLDAVHPITHAVGNTIKRVILILFSVVRFGTPMTTQRSARHTSLSWRAAPNTSFSCGHARLPLRVRVLRPPWTLPRTLTMWRRARWQCGRLDDRHRRRLCLFGG